MGAPFRSEWHGKDGTISRIRIILGLPYSSSNQRFILNSLVEVLYCVQNNIDYNGIPRSQEQTQGRPPVIDVNDKFLCRLIADCVENGFGLQNTTRHVNAHLVEMAMPIVTASAVFGVQRRMKPISMKIKSRPQGNADPNSVWAKARLAWYLQLLICFGDIDLDKLDELSVVDNELVIAIRETIPTPLPDCYNKDKLIMFDLKRTLWFDEHHREAVIGTDGIKSETQTLFPRDEHGDIDLEHGEYKEAKQKLKMKYNDEARFCFGCCWDGTKGILCKEFVYTGQMIVVESQYKKYIEEEIKRVKNNSKGGAYWIHNRRDGRVWSDDPVDMAEHVGNKMKEKLHLNQLLTVGQIAALADEEIRTIAKQADARKRIGFTTLRKIRDKIEISDDPKPDPMVLNHTKAENPYLSKFGEADWKSRVQQSFNVKKYCCVLDLAEYMVAEGYKLYPDGNFWFYHDALSLLTSKETRIEMEKRGILRHWILPQLGLNGGTAFAGRPVGNTPEGMPWDCVLNNCLIISVMYHVSVTAHLADTDPRKFKLKTPGDITSAYQRVLAAGIPSSSRIETDVLKVLRSARMIIKARGALVPGLGNRMGRRARMGQLSGINRGNWGGARTKGSGETLSVLKALAPDAKSAWDEKMGLLRRGRSTKDGSEDKKQEEHVDGSEDEQQEEHVDGSEVVFLVENEVMEEDCEDCE
jgi:hypothetical protein